MAVLLPTISSTAILLRELRLPVPLIRDLDVFPEEFLEDSFCDVLVVPLSLVDCWVPFSFVLRLDPSLVFDVVKEPSFVLEDVEEPSPVFEGV